MVKRLLLIRPKSTPAIPGKQIQPKPRTTYRSDDRSGSNNTNSKLVDLDIINIRTLRSQGVTRSQVYMQYEGRINWGGFLKIWNGETWKHLL